MQVTAVASLQELAAANSFEGFVICPVIEPPRGADPDPSNPPGDAQDPTFNILVLCANEPTAQSLNAAVKTLRIRFPLARRAPPRSGLPLFGMRLPLRKLETDERGFPRSDGKRSPIDLEAESRLLQQEIEELLRSL